jgi:hypothetical protein
MVLLATLHSKRVPVLTTLVVEGEGDKFILTYLFQDAGLMLRDRLIENAVFLTSHCAVRVKPSHANATILHANAATQLQDHTTFIVATDDNTIRRIRIACWITKSTEHTFIMFNSYCLSAATMVTRTGFNATFIRTRLLLLVYSLQNTINCNNMYLAECTSFSRNLIKIKRIFNSQKNQQYFVMRITKQVQYSCSFTTCHGLFCFHNKEN